MHNAETRGKTLRLLRMNNPELGTRFTELTREANDLGTPCQGDPEAWWDDDVEAQKYAARACQSCPVLTQCRDWALLAHEREGVWGGTTPGERAKFQLQMRRERERERKAMYSADPVPEDLYANLNQAVKDYVPTLDETREQIMRERGL